MIYNDYVGHVNAKEKQGRRAKERKGTEAQKAKTPTPTRVIDALIGDGEQNEKQKNKKKETVRGPSTQLPWTLRSPPTTRRDHTVSLFFYIPRPTGEIKCLLFTY